MITIALPAEMEERLRGEAQRQGLAAETLAVKLIDEHLPITPINGSMTDLFAQWQAEDATSDPAELQRRRQEMEDLKKALNQNRLDMEGPSSRRPFP